MFNFEKSAERGRNTERNKSYAPKTLFVTVKKAGKLLHEREV